MTDSTLILSADQTDQIHQSVLKQHNKAAAAQASGVTRVSGPSLGAGTVELQVGGGGDEDVQITSDAESEEYLLDPRPFASIMSRLGAPSAVPKKAPKAAPKPVPDANKKVASAEAKDDKRPKLPKATRKATATETGGTKRTRTKEPETEKLSVKAEPADPTSPKSSRMPATGTMSPEDVEIVSGFQDQLDVLARLDVASGVDDASFNSWTKTHLSKLSELKGTISTKKKSLGRRKTGDTQEVVDCLQAIIVQITDVFDFLRMFNSSSTNGGREVIETLVKLVDAENVYPSPGLWERALKVEAMEDLKVAQFDGFFNKTYNMCIDKLGKESGGNFFVSWPWQRVETFVTCRGCGGDVRGSVAEFSFQVLLASQILQKLVKGVNAVKITQDSLQFLHGYLEEMWAQRLKVLDGKCDEEEDALSAVKLLVDMTSPPGQVLSVCERHFAKTGTTSASWILAPFTHERGRRILEAIRENAKKRSNQSSILEELDKQTKAIESKHLLDIETSITVGNAKAFSAEYGKLLKDSHKTLVSQAAKALKGNDKQMLDKLKDVLQSAIVTVVEAFFTYNVIPFMIALSKAAANKSVEDLPMSLNILDDKSAVSTCLFQVGNTLESKSVNGAIVFAKSLQLFASKVQDALKGTIKAVDCQKAIETWNSSTCDVLKQFPDRDSDTRLKDAIAQLSSSAHSILQLNVGTEASEYILKCMKIAHLVGQGNYETGEETKQELKMFDEHIEKAKLMSSVMDDGQNIRSGMDIIKMSVHSDFCICGLLDGAEDDEGLDVEEFDDADWKAVGDGCKLASMSAESIQSALKSLVASVASCESTELEEAGVDREIFAEVVSKHVKVMADGGMKLLRIVQQRFKTMYGNLSKPDVVLPKELDEISEDSLKDMKSIIEKIQATFTAEKTSTVSEVACTCETLACLVTHASKFVDGKSPKDMLPEISTVQELRTSCLSWMNLA